MNQFNGLIGDEPTDSPREWNSEPPTVHFKYHNCPTQTSPVVLAVMERLNCHGINSGDVEIYPSNHLVESTSDYITDT